MYFIRMMLLWLVLIARCSGSDEIPLYRADQSNTYQNYSADRAIDGNLYTESIALSQSSQWLRVYFTSSSTVQRVVVEKGYSNGPACVWTVSVYDGEAGTVCGTYTDIPDRYNLLYFATLTLLL